MEAELKPGTAHFSTFEIDQFIDGELSQDSSSELEDHLPICQPCRAGLRERQILHLTIAYVFTDPMFDPAGLPQFTSGIASNFWSVLGRRPLSGKETLIIWFIGLVMLATLRMTSADVDLSIAGVRFLPDNLTTTGHSVNFLMSGLEAFSILLLHASFQ